MPHLMLVHGHYLFLGHHTVPYHQIKSIKLFERHQLTLDIATYYTATLQYGSCTVAGDHYMLSL
jgi:hypothetical protein